jgi:hypothetical protein
MGKWGSQGSGDGQFDYPSGIALDPSDNVYVVDRNLRRVQKFSPNGAFLGKWGSFGAADGQFSDPINVAMARDGSAYVLDVNRIHRFSPLKTLTYTPAPNYSGPDGFTVKVTDRGDLDNCAPGPSCDAAKSDEKTVAVTVNPVNDAPTAIGESYETDQGAALAVGAPGVLVNDADIDGPALSAVLVSGTSAGGLGLNPNGSFAYTPNSGFSGTDSFKYKANDGALQSGEVTVTINVKAVAPPPPPPPPPPATCTMIGTAGPNILNGTDGPDVICAGAGRDFINGHGGDDVIYGGPGHDEMIGGAGNDVLLGEEDGDLALVGQEGDDVIHGGPGDDVFLSGGEGKDELYGDDGSERLAGGPGNDRLEGGAGKDILGFLEGSGPVRVDLAKGSATGEGNDDLSSLEIVQGTPFADKIEGGPGDDELYGGSGNDTINGRAGFDFINGQAGIDDCDGGPGGGEPLECENKKAKAAGATTSASSSFTAPGQTATQTAPITPGSPGFTASLSWGDPWSSFEVVAEVVPPGTATFSFAGIAPDKKRAKRPVRIRLKVRRGGTYMTVTGSVPKKYRVKGARLRFKIKATKLAKRTTVRTTVTQKRRR